MQGICAVAGAGDHAISAAIRVENTTFGARCKQQQAGNKDKL
jgi:hypothetical protein